MHLHPFDYGEELLAALRIETGYWGPVGDRTPEASREHPEWELHPRAGWDRFQEARTAVMRTLRAPTGGSPR